MTPASQAAHRIGAHLSRVSSLREQASAAGLVQAVHQVKQLQAQRFRATYTDFLADAQHAPATRFFLEELYGEHDFRERDNQFGRIASAIERLFPEAVAQLAVDLAETHALTETLDHQLATHWLDQDPATPAALRYAQSWRLTGRHADRHRQLAVVLHMGAELQRLTRMVTLRIALKMMRRPAQAAGLYALQQFLERGFDAFATMSDASRFLSAIEQRERRWIDTLFEADAANAAQLLQAELMRT
ncbi:FFLEELY motif protein [Hydrogenophaga sp.]|uniref:FFLEELY motif protein n=1 Tax=Hydrogenophaga sp. TaxID=1904254 RepID=UPI003F6B9029